MTSDNDANGRSIQRSSINSLSDDEFVAQYEDYVMGIAVKLRRGLRLRIDLEDLRSYGFEGLLQARERYRDDSPAAFKSFAYYRVRGAMIDGCRKEGWMGRERNVKVRRAEKVHESVEVAGRVNDFLESRASAFAEAPPARSLDESLSRIGDMAGDVITIMFLEDERDLDASLEPAGGDQIKKIEGKQRSRQVAEALKRLEEVERTVLRRHHFFNEPLSKIGEEIGKSTSWTSRIHARAIEKMRVILLESGYDPLA